ncbi:hypothetical protein AC1031_002430 [Aphanomyces cochlioides]|nr:hypothetical protein AC1031_002430 [Aphanomyces cochlioides]
MQSKATKRRKPQFTFAYISKWARVVSNLYASIAIFVTGCIVVVLLTQGMFHTTNMSVLTQDTWTTRYQSCRLSASGFTSCDPADVAVTGNAPWTGIGLLQLAAEIDLGIPTARFGAGTASAWFQIFLIGSKAEPSRVELSRAKPMSRLKNTQL